MTQQTKATWISGVFIFTPLVAFTLFQLFGSTAITIHHTTIPMGLVGLFTLLLVLKLIFIVAAIAFVVQAFRVHWGWGLANLLVPLAFIAFCFIHPRAAKIPLVIFGVGIWWLLMFCYFMHISQSKT
jgi:hypothetical protein